MFKRWRRAPKHLMHHKEIPQHFLSVYNFNAPISIFWFGVLNFVLRYPLKKMLRVFNDTLHCSAQFLCGNPRASPHLANYHSQNWTLWSRSSSLMVWISVGIIVFPMRSLHGVFEMWVFQAVCQSSSCGDRRSVFCTWFSFSKFMDVCGRLKRFLWWARRFYVLQWMVSTVSVAVLRISFWIVFSLQRFWSSGQTSAFPNKVDYLPVINYVSNMKSN